ncbi:galectin-1-like [Trichosurus vulpecula]|uniref:galectin-1-like n=1 Tax=Trichosurus vulpecula TaxID=9337 RepID=UPI00186B0ED9|nr:galectin-1-like [Trichosurus vulpecula]
MNKSSYHELELKRLQLQPGARIKVKGYIHSAAERFAINLGKDEDNIILHFNPRFNYATDRKIIVCNSKHEGHWAAEQRITNFPYEHMRTIDVYFDFEGERFKITLHNGYEFTFPNRLNLHQIDYIIIYGDFLVRKVDFE